jgi:hypothetical protein
MYLSIWMNEYYILVKKKSGETLGYIFKLLSIVSEIHML